MSNISYLFLYYIYLRYKIYVENRHHTVVGQLCQPIKKASISMEEQVKKKKQVGDKSTYTDTEVNNLQYTVHQPSYSSQPVNINTNWHTPL